MAEKLTDEQVGDLLTTVRGDGAVDTKVAAVTAAKTAIKQHNVPDTSVAPLFEALRLASQAQHAVLVNAGFTSLVHLLTRVSLQEPKWIIKEAKHTLPILVEKMGDQKEKTRLLAMQAMATVYKVSPTDAERFVRNIAMVGKNPRAKESSLTWLLERHQQDGLQFRPYVPQLMELLEDADGMVRDTAKRTVIELFRNASGPAKSDLKRQLKNFKVRPAIEQAIVKELVPSGSSTAERPESRTASRAGSVPPARQLNPSASVSSMTERPTTPLVPDKPESVEPLFVNSKGEFDDIIRDMHFFFEGRETEQNWLKREESITKLRRLIAGNASSDYPDQFITHLRSLLDGILKAVNSLRTSLSKEGSSLVQEIALAFGPGMDPMVELFLQAFIKLTASTKKIASQLANATVDTIIGQASYSTRIMQHIWGAAQEKNAQPRTYVSGWLKTILKKEANTKNHLEHGGGLELVEKSITKGLNDPNPGAREGMRATYWLFHTMWPTKADAIMNKLDSTAQKLLLKDPNNPKSPPKRDTATTTSRPGMGLSKSTIGSAKPSLRETMMAQKKAALAAKKNNLPPRPGSAMAHFSPVRVASTASTASGASSGPPSAHSNPTSTTRHGIAHSGSGVLGAPVRMARKRPEMVARPATAGPYSVRGHDAPGAHSTSPAETKPKTSRPPKTLEVSPKRAMMGRRQGHAPHASESSIPSPSRLSHQTSAPSPRTTPRVRPITVQPPHHAPSSPHKPEESGLEEFTLLVPSIHPPKDLLPPAQLAENGLSPVLKEPEEAMDDASTLAASTQQSPAMSFDPSLDEHGIPRSPMSLVASTPKAVVAGTPKSVVKVYEDPFTPPKGSADDESATPKPALVQHSVLEDIPVSINENNTSILPLRPHNGNDNNLAPPTPISPGDGPSGISPQKSLQNARLLDSGITRVKAKSLDVHGLRKLQSILRADTTPNGTGKAACPLPDDKFDALLLALFAYLEAPLPVNTTPEKAGDVKTQILSTIRLLMKRGREGFRPHVSRGLEAVLGARGWYEGHSHMLSGFEVLAGELVGLGDGGEIVVTMVRALQGLPRVASTPSSPAGEWSAKDAASSDGDNKQERNGEARKLSMGLLILRLVIDTRPDYHPTSGELRDLSGLAARCLESGDSGVRMDAVDLCVAMHAKIGVPPPNTGGVGGCGTGVAGTGGVGGMQTVGAVLGEKEKERVQQQRFWEEVLGGMRDGPKSLITYYVVKRQREQEREKAGAVGGGGRDRSLSGV